MSPATGSDLVYRTFGRAGADRTVAVVRTGAVATTDPDPRVTLHRAVRVVGVRMTVLEVDDPDAYGGETPDQEYAHALAEVLHDQGASPDHPIGLVGVGGAGWSAITAASMMDGAIDRLALVGVPRIDDVLDEDEIAQRVRSVEARTLILVASHDPAATRSDATWLRRACARGRVETISSEGPLSLRSVWSRVLSHTAPGTVRSM